MTADELKLCREAFDEWVDGAEEGASETDKLTRGERQIRYHWFHLGFQAAWNAKPQPRTEEVRELLESLRLGHQTCEDRWYSCPKSPEGCLNDAEDPDQCTCGADLHNSRIDAALAKLDKGGQDE